MVGVSDGELGARGETGAEGEEKESDGEEEGSKRGARENRNVKLSGRGKSAPIVAKRQGVDDGV